jgi:hypothetical protein
VSGDRAYMFPHGSLGENVSLENQQLDYRMSNLVDLGSSTPPSSLSARSKSGPISIVDWVYIQLLVVLNHSIVDPPDK